MGIDSKMKIDFIKYNSFFPSIGRISGGIWKRR
jgi:hypothetical protein